MWLFEGRARWICAGPWLMLGLGACAPTLNWREIGPEGTRVRLLLPCKPAVQSRHVPMAGARIRLSLYVCKAGGQSWALAWADVEDPARVGPALQQLRASAKANLGAATEAEAAPLGVVGATPNPDARRIRLAGKGADGAPLAAEVAVFVHGTQVFQATVLGTQIPAEAGETFFGSLRVVI